LRFANTPTFLHLRDRAMSVKGRGTSVQPSLLHLLNRVEAEDVEAFGEDGGCGLAQ
jgi:hypothetical protein